MLLKCVFVFWFVLCALLSYKCVGVLCHEVVSYSLTLWTIAH